LPEKRTRELIRNSQEILWKFFRILPEIFRKKTAIACHGFPQIRSGSGSRRSRNFVICGRDRLCRPPQPPRSSKFTAHASAMIVATTLEDGRILAAKASQLGKWASKAALERILGPYQPPPEIPAAQAQRTYQQAMHA
jgi:hypothetical protein